MFARTFDSEAPVARVVFALGRLAVEEFDDSLLLCGNDRGFGGIKLLRALFERVITMMYLIRNPDRVGDFLDRHHIDRGKVLHQMQAAGIDLSKRLTKQEIDAIEAEYQRVRPRYTETLCATCNTTRDSISWSRLDLASMARAVGVKAYLEFAYWPILHLHSTVFSLIAILDASDEGLTVNVEAQRRQVHNALIAAQGCLVIILIEQARYFGLPLDEAEVLRYYSESWPSSG